MLRHIWILMLGAVSMSALAADGAPKKAADFLVRERVWPIHIQVADFEWQAMQPAKKGGFAWLFGPKLPGRPAIEADRPKTVSPFGYEYPYGHANVEIAGVMLNNVGVRFKGNSSFATARGNKRPYKLDFDRFAEQQFVGLTMLNLSNNVMDPSCLREALAYDFFRAAGVAAPRTTFAQVYLTVDSQHQREYLGLYTAVECVDKKFLKDRFGQSKGLLAKPEKAGGIPYLGADWTKYPTTYGVKNTPSPADQRRLMEFAKLIHKADDAEFQAKIAEYLDMEAFLRLMAANCLIGNLDSFFGLGHNYYLYLNPANNRFVIIPWDLDHSFGSLGMAATHEEMMKWSVVRPYLGNNRLPARVLAIPVHNARYREHLQTMLAGPYKMTERVEATKKAIAAARADEPHSKATTKGPPRPDRVTDISLYVTNRAASARDQLEGKALGVDVAWSPFGRPGALGVALSEKMLLAADADKDGKLSLVELENAGKTWFTAMATDAAEQDSIVVSIERLLPPAGKVPLPVKGLVTGFCKQAASEDQPLKLEATLATIKRLFVVWDRDHNEKLDRDELTRGINGLVVK